MQSIHNPLRSTYPSLWLHLPWTTSSKAEGSFPSLPQTEGKESGWLPGRIPSSNRPERPRQVCSDRVFPGKKNKRLCCSNIQPQADSVLGWDPGSSPYSSTPFLCVLGQVPALSSNNWQQALSLPGCARAGRYSQSRALKHGAMQEGSALARCKRHGLFVHMQPWRNVPRHRKLAHGYFPSLQVYGWAVLHDRCAPYTWMNCTMDVTLVWTFQLLPGLCGSLCLLYKERK